ncbi:MAG: homoserine kinase, partial [Chthoniobacterales bacterium]
PDTARVRIPATTANLGPGFDALGIALRLANTVTVSRNDAPPPEKMIAEAADRFFTAASLTPFPFAWEISGDVPRSRGLGSSVTVRLGILHSLNELTDRPLAPDAIYRLCADLEGHPDNAAPAAFGGFTVARRNNDYQRFRVTPDLNFVLLIPDFEVETEAARTVLPATIPFREAVTNVANTAAITAALASRNYPALAGCFEDHLHQPQRAALVPCLSAVLGAAREVGALGGWLSGSGSTVACVTLDDPDPIAEAMIHASGCPGARTVTTTADNRGVLILTPR